MIPLVGFNYFLIDNERMILQARLYIYIAKHNQTHFDSKMFIL